MLNLSRTFRNAAIGLAGTLATCGAAIAQSDQEQTVPTGWGWHYNVDPATVDSYVAAGNRITDIEIANVSPLRFNTVYVANSGAYAKGWWWYYGITAQQVTDFLNTNNARLIDLERYEVNGENRFACVMIANTGQDASGWWWLWNVSAATLNDFIDNNPARIIDLDTYLINGTRYYSAVMVQNTGAQARTWYYYYNVSPAFISQQINDLDLRIVDLEPHDVASNTWTVVLQRTQGEHWWWYYGITAQQVSDFCAQNGSRLIDLERYDTPGGVRFAVAMLNNSNAVTTRIGDILRNGTDGDSGCYLKRVDGPVLAGLQQDQVFEPASMIKVLHHTHALLRVQAGAIALNSMVNVFTGMNGSCPQDSGPMSEQLQTALRAMMENSDNSRTQAMRALFGEANINATAATLGLASTGIHHRIGCAGGADGAIADPNMFTLTDAGRLYEAVADGLLTPSLTDTFYDLMADSEGNGFPGTLQTIINEEAATVGLTPAQASAFRDLVRTANKGGSYGLNPGTGTYYHQTRGGWARLPFKSGCTLAPREFVHGSFVNFASNDTDASNAASEAFWELLRDQVRAAIQTWDDCRVDWNSDGIVNSQDLFDFLQDFFAGRADYNRDRLTNSQDFFDFLSDFFRN